MVPGTGLWLMGGGGSVARVSETPEGGLRAGVWTPEGGWKGSGNFVPGASTESERITPEEAGKLFGVPASTFVP